MILPGDAAAILVGALLIDALVGDPDWLWRRWPHPVAWAGRLVALGDRWLNRDGWGASARRAAGAGWLGLLLAMAVAFGWGLEQGLRALQAGPLWVALAASVLLAGHSLHAHVARVRDALLTGGLAEGRVAVGMIVGRDPASLDESGVARAAIESAAENFSDGVVAPAFWFALGGLPGLCAYKTLNTADSMIGHLSDRHRAFGWASARLDDAANLVPARLAGLLLALAAPLAGGAPSRAIRVMWRDAGLHRSPNAGWPEAAMAGALGLALGGPRIYAAGPVDEPFLNPKGSRSAGAPDIGRALRIMLGAAVFHLCTYVALWCVLASRQ